jgi:hypothetical protein
MDYQIKNNRKDAAIKLNRYEEELSYYAWPQIFSSTSGPFDGIGGQSISTFTIECWTDGKQAILYCNDKEFLYIKKFNIIKAISGNYTKN